MRWSTIVVGVDGSAGSRAALTWAAAEAARHGAGLVVLTAWESVLPPPMGLPSVPRDVPDLGRFVEETQLAVIEEELGRNPPVVVHPRVTHGTAAKALIGQSAHADLLVVGSRGHGGFAGLLLGSVSQHVVAYAKCPVIVVR